MGLERVASYARCVCTSPRGLGVLGLGDLGSGVGIGVGLGLGVGLERRCVRAVRLHVAVQLRWLLGGLVARAKQYVLEIGVRTHAQQF